MLAPYKITDSFKYPPHYRDPTEQNYVSCIEEVQKM